jgi:AraC-like DNA-binding protein/quercetin dioxygenase-like cupin family protein
MKPRKSSARSTPVAPEFFSPQVAEARRFYLDLNPPKQRRLTLVCGGVEHCTPDYTIHRTTFPFYSIEYVACGHGELKLQGRTHALQPGRLFSYGPGVPHHIIGDRNDPLVKYFVDFAGTGAPDLLRSCHLAPGQVAQVYPPNTLSPLFDELIQSGLQVGRRNTGLCMKLLECLALKIAAANAPLEGAETLAFTTYQQCRRHIEQNFARLRTLEQIARECHANNAYICRLFRRYDRQTPYQYLLLLKMNYAAERLQQPGLLVKQVAEEAGFADPFHFSRVFRTVLGLSPASFRRFR